MQIGDKVGIVCCSNGQPLTSTEKINQLRETLKDIGLHPVLGDCIFQKESVFSGSGMERAESLMRFYRDDEIKDIFDISGGDLANEILPYLDYDVIASSEKMFWGYSDLTTVLNAIYAKTGKQSVLYQVRNLISKDNTKQIKNFIHTTIYNRNDLVRWEYQFVQGTHMEGIVVGGNIRCLLKLAGTEYFPDMTNKILLLEARSGKVPQMVAFLSQLKQLKVFEKINGILLGTFTQMEEEACQPDIVSLVKSYVGEDLPIVKTFEIGHGTDSQAVVIGKYISLS